MSDHLVTPKQLAERFGTTTSRLAQDRYMGRGPRFVKLGRTIRYTETDIQAWIDANTHERTA